jgi:cyanophycinase
MGFVLLEGGAEFGGRMKEPDLRALELAGGADARISIIPAAAAPDNNHHRAGNNGRRWFEGLGAKAVSSLPLIDRTSAADQDILEQLKISQMVYMLGGFPHHLVQTLAGSASWLIMLQVIENGGVIAGSSAGAMILCEYFFDPFKNRIESGLGLLPGICIVPHHDSFGNKWYRKLNRLLPGVTLVGIDEETGIIDDAPDGFWNIYGKGGVTIYSDSNILTYQPGKSVPRDVIPGPQTQTER